MTVRGHRTLLPRSVATILANAVHFERLRARLEPVLARLLAEQSRDALVADLDRARADVADQERHLVRFVRVMAADERIDRFELVDEAVLEQEIERAIDRRRRRAAAALAELIEQQARGFGFRAKAQTLEVHGVCKGCRAA